MTPGGGGPGNQEEPGGVAHLRNLLAALGPPDQPPSPREVAELVWFATHLPARPTRPVRPSPTPTADTPVAGTGAKPSGSATAPAVGPTRLYVAPDATPAPAEGASAGDRVSPIRLTGAAALPGTRGLARALRPFKRRVPQRFASVLDEELTADWIARFRQWMPVLRPADGRWLSAALVLDECSGSAAFWDPIARELHGFLQLLGAFHDVHLYRLRPGAGGRPAVVAESGAAPLLPAAGYGGWADQRITLVLTDLVAQQWRSPELRALLRGWAAAGPAVVVQMLPEHLWRRTSLPSASGRFRVPGGARPTTETCWTPYGLAARRQARVPDRTRITVPVLELAPEWLAPWANAVTSGGQFDGAALLLPGPGVDLPPFPPVERSADPLAVFRATASPDVFRLAAYLAAVPLNPSIMRMVQTTMMPGSPPSALAEIVFSGLLERIPGTTADPLSRVYEFTAGVREQLRRTIRRDDIEDVRTALTAYRPRPGDARFTAAVTDPAGPGVRPPGAEHWAEVRRSSRTRQDYDGDRGAVGGAWEEDQTGRNGAHGGSGADPSGSVSVDPSADRAPQRDRTDAERSFSSSDLSPVGAVSAPDADDHTGEEAIAPAATARDRTEDADALVSQGQEHREAGRHEEAIADFTAALVLEPDNARAFGGRGEAHRLARRYEEAISDFTAALELKPDYAWAFTRRGRALQQSNRYEEAIADLTTALDLTPDAVVVLAERGETLRLAGRYEEAVSDFTAALELKPDYAWALASRGQAHRQQGQYEEAVADLTAAMELDPADAWTLTQRGLTQQSAGRYEEAVSDFTAALELKPDYAWVLASRGQVHRQQGRYEEAITDLTAALELEPKYAWISVERGETLRFAGRYEEAIADFTAVLELKPEDGWALICRGETLRLAGRYEEAIADYTAVLELKPDYAWALTSRGQALRQQGRYEEAITDLRSAAEFRRDSDWTHHELALALTLAGKSGAQEEWRRAVRILVNRIAVGEIDMAHLKGNYAVVLCAMGEWEAAAEQVDSFLAYSPTAPRIADALEDLDDLATVLPLDPEKLDPLLLRLRVAECATRAAVGRHDATTGA